MSEQSKTKYDTLKQPAQSKQMLAYQQIKEDILNNTFPEGTVMVERKLCDIYQVSRSPIRNALQQLTHEGLLSFVPGKGVVVSSFSTEDILEVYDLIELLQLYAVSACIAKGSLTAVEALSLTLSNMEKTISGGELFQCTRWDQKFHELLIEYAGNSRLKNMYEQLACQQTRFMTTILNDTTLADRSLAEHREIVNAIADKNVSAAEECIRTHYRNIKQYYINKLLARLQI